jgi:membrane protease YdiL (CAAX protease family)
MRKAEKSSSRLLGLGMVTLTTLVFVLLVVGLNWVARHLFANIIALGIRQRVTVELTAAMVAEVLVLLLVIVCLRKRGLTLRSLGLSASSTRVGWVAAALVAALFLAFNLGLPLRNETRFSEISIFHIYNALAAGFVAGLVEELLFRGYVMTELQRSGWGRTGQVLISAISYGAVHASWGIISGAFTFQLIGGAVIGTAIFGLCCSAVYLASRRNLLPVMLCHGLIDFTIEPWLFMLALSMMHS